MVRSARGRRSNHQRPGGARRRRALRHRPRQRSDSGAQDYNDFVFSVIAQELGFVGGMVVIALFVALAWAGIRTALRAPDTFGGLLAAGITAWISFQAIINICVVLMLVPVTGITLPFVSQGGSSLIVSFAAVGICCLSLAKPWSEVGSMRLLIAGGGTGGTYLPGSRSSSIVAGPTGRA